MDKDKLDSKENIKAAVLELHDRLGVVEQITTHNPKPTGGPPSPSDSEVTAHSPGLCAQEACKPCAHDRLVLAQQVSLQLFKDLDYAARYAGVADHADALFTAWRSWQDAGKPEPPAVEEEPQVLEVVG